MCQRQPGEALLTTIAPCALSLGVSKWQRNFRVAGGFASPNRLCGHRNSSRGKINFTNQFSFTAFFHDLHRKYFTFQKLESILSRARPASFRRAARDRHGRRKRDAMDVAAVRQAWWLSVTGVWEGAW